MFRNRWLCQYLICEYKAKIHALRESHISRLAPFWPPFGTLLWDPLLDPCFGPLFWTPQKKKRSTSKNLAGSSEMRARSHSLVGIFPKRGPKEGSQRRVPRGVQRGVPRGVPKGGSKGPQSGTPLEVCWSASGLCFGTDLLVETSRSATCTLQVVWKLCRCGSGCRRLPGRVKTLGNEFPWCLTCMVCKQSVPRKWNRVFNRGEPSLGGILQGRRDMCDSKKMVKRSIW